MSLRNRDNKLAYYRLFFIYLIFALGALGIVILTLEQSGISIISAEIPSSSYEAILATSWVSSIICFSSGLLMLSLSKERRQEKHDRRGHNIAIDFPDRRKTDRRS